MAATARPDQHRLHQRLVDRDMDVLAEIYDQFDLAHVGHIDEIGVDVLLSARPRAYENGTTLTVDSGTGVVGERTSRSFNIRWSRPAGDAKRHERRSASRQHAHRPSQGPATQHAAEPTSLAAVVLDQSSNTQPGDIGAVCSPGETIFNRVDRQSRAGKRPWPGQVRDLAPLDTRLPVGSRVGESTASQHSMNA